LYEEYERVQLPDKNKIHKLCTNVEPIGIKLDNNMKDVEAIVSNDINKTKLTCSFFIKQERDFRIEPVDLIGYINEEKNLRKIVF